MITAAEARELTAAATMNNGSDLAIQRYIDAIECRVKDAADVGCDDLWVTIWDISGRVDLPFPSFLQLKALIKSLEGLGYIVDVDGNPRGSETPIRIMWRDAVEVNAS